MDYHDTIKSLKINFKKNIGTVVLVVEGAEYEFKLFKRIFRDILHYNFITKSRNQKDFKEYNEFVMKGNELSRIIIINTKNSNIGSIDDEITYRNELYKRLYNEYNLDIKNVAVYYIWDRDRNSNNYITIKRLLKQLNNPYENENYENGLLLLSYPCCESYTISSFEKNKKFIEIPIKDYVKKNHFYISKIDKHKVLSAALEMLKK